MKSYWYKSKNFGDTLTQVIVEHFTGKKLEWVDRGEKGKLLAVGSILSAMREGDTVWGAGLIRDEKKERPKNVRILALRGPKTAENLGLKFSPIYGDPAILLPKIYNPTVEKKYKVGVIPHYVETDVKVKDGDHRIDIMADWKTVVEEVKACELILSSSLHGIICAEAYGVPVMWVKFSDKIIGGDFKFQDYFLGTGRTEQPRFTKLPPIPGLEHRQWLLISILKQL